MTEDRTPLRKALDDLEESGRRLDRSLFWLKIAVAALTVAVVLRLLVSLGVIA